MGKVIDIDKDLPHKANEVICINCKYRYISVRPAQVALKNLQCPNCNEVGYTIETGD